MTTHQTAPDPAQGAPDVGAADQSPLARLETLCDQWLPVPDIAQLWDISVVEVRRMIDDGELPAVRRGPRNVLSVPHDLVSPTLVDRLSGTVTLLRDGGMDTAEVIEWLLTDDPTLPGRPVDQLRQGRRGEVRRRAQAVAF